MQKYLYFRQSSTLTDDHDEVTGSTVYPVSSFQGMCAGDAALGGAVADDDEEYGIEEQKLSAIFQFARRCHFFLYLLLTSKLIPKNERDQIYDRM